MFCSKCGKETEASALFCTDCGFSLAESPSDCTPKEKSKNPVIFCLIFILIIGILTEVTYNIIVEESSPTYSQEFQPFSSVFPEASNTAPNIKVED